MCVSVLFYMKIIDNQVSRKNEDEITCLLADFRIHPNSKIDIQNKNQMVPCPANLSQVIPELDAQQMANNCVFLSKLRLALAVLECVSAMPW